MATSTVDRPQLSALLLQLDSLLQDEDIQDDQLREASEGLLPNVADALRELLGKFCLDRLHGQLSGHELSQPLLCNLEKGHEGDHKEVNGVGGCIGWARKRAGA